MFSFYCRGLAAVITAFMSSFMDLAGRCQTRLNLQTVQLLSVYSRGADTHLNGSLTTCSAFMM